MGTGQYDQAVLARRRETSVPLFLRYARVYNERPGVDDSRPAVIGGPCPLLGDSLPSVYPKPSARQ